MAEEVLVSKVAIVSGSGKLGGAGEGTAIVLAEQGADVGLFQGFINVEY